MDNGKALLAATLANPVDDMPPLLLADWLEENGAPELGVCLRMAVALRRGEGRTVYLVNHGEYSDYTVDGVFTSKEAAERFMAAAGAEGRGYFNDLEERDLDCGMEKLAMGLIPFSVGMLATGDDATAVRINPFGGEVSGNFYDWWKGQHARAFRVMVWAKDERHAIKIANEKRAAALAGIAAGT